MMQLMFTVRQHIRLISIIWKLVPTAPTLLCKDSQNSNFIGNDLRCFVHEKVSFENGRISYCYTYFLLPIEVHISSMLLAKGTNKHNVALRRIFIW